MTKNRTLMFLGIAAGIICIGMAFVYWTTPAKDLPLPNILGHDSSSAVHVKHGIASFLVLNAAAWVAFWVWMSGRTRRSWGKIPYDPPGLTPAGRLGGASTTSRISPARSEV